MKTKILSCISLFVIAISFIGCHNYDTPISTPCYRYIFKIEIITENSQASIPFEDIFIVYYDKNISIAAYKPEKPNILFDHEGPIADFYGAYYTFKSQNKAKICFGEVDLLNHKNQTTQLELHIGDKAYAVSAKYDIHSEQDYLYLDNVLVDDDFISIKY